MGRSTTLGLALAAIVLIGGAGLVMWALQGANASRAWIWIAAALWLAAALSALHFWVRQPVGVIAWDGQSWVLEVLFPAVETSVLPAPPQVFLDLQSHLWLFAAPTAQAGVWVWLERAGQPERWMDLRRAVYSRAAFSAGPAGKTAPRAVVERES